MYNMFKLRAMLLMGLLKYSQGQDANCDYSQTVAVGQTYYIYSPGYANNYTAGVKCRWLAKCPTGYNCRLDCTDITLPSSPSCTLDRLLISKIGDPQLTSADYHCGRGTLTAVSTGQNMSIGLFASLNSPGGHFLCTLTAQVANTSAQCSCGFKKTNRIVGGQETSPNEFPMMAGIIYRSHAAIKCGAVVIDRRYVLSAAHCVFNKSISDLGVIVGEHNITTGSDTSATQGFAVVTYIVHPQYNSSTYDYDVAVVTVNGQIAFSDSVGPVCLPFKFANNDLTGTKVTILGWGTLYTGGPTSNVLNKVEVDVISQTTCKSQVPTLTARQMCTYTQGKDSCQDDSGGPVLYTDPATGKLCAVGIISYGRFCVSSEPGVNTRVTTVLDWIVSNAPANYCRI